MARSWLWMNRTIRTSTCSRAFEAKRRASIILFSIFIYKNRDLTRLPLIERRAILRSVLRFRTSYPYCRLH